MMSDPLRERTGIFYQPMCSPDDADVVIMGFPFDGTVTGRPGARSGPQGIRAATYGIEDYSPYQDRDIADVRLSDIGDAELPYGDTEATLACIGEEYRALMNVGAKCMAFGGEHLVTWPLIEAVYDRFGSDLFVIQLDAHADLREDYLGVKYSHATVMKWVSGLVGRENTAVIGIRSGTGDEWNILRAHPNYFSGALGRPLDEFTRWAADALNGRKVYVTIDLDVFDPGIMPGTGTPEPGGISFKDFIGVVHALENADIIGADIVELAPDYDHSGVSQYLAGVVLRELLLLMGRNHAETAW
jgi:agmatinase